MKKADLQKVADKVFKSNPDADKAFVTTDGQAFISKNSADLHANTSKKKDKLKVVEFTASGVADDSDNKKVGSKKKKVNKPTKAELQKTATELGVPFKPKDSNATLIDAIKAKQKEIAEAEKAKIEAVDYSKMSPSELQQIAAKLEIEYNNESTTPEQLIEAIKAKQEELKNQ